MEKENLNLSPDTSIRRENYLERDERLNEAIYLERGESYGEKRKYYTCDGKLCDTVEEVIGYNEYYFKLREKQYDVPNRVTNPINGARVFPEELESTNRSR